MEVAEPDKHWKKKKRSYSFNQSWSTILRWENKLICGECRETGRSSQYLQWQLGLTEFQKVEMSAIENENISSGRPQIMLKLLTMIVHSV